MSSHCGIKMRQISKNVIDFTPVYRRTLGVSRVSGRAGLLFAGCPAPRHRGKHPANVTTSSIRRDAVCRETYVCSQLRLTVGSRHALMELCHHPKNNGPLHDVNLDRSEEEKRRLANPGNGTVLPLFVALGSVYTPTPRSIGNKAVPTSQERMSRREQTP
jgi:hypothetical protein